MAFAQHMEEIGVRVLRVVNDRDVVPKVPGILINEKFGRLAKRLSWLPWTYSHVGVQLTLRDKSSPFLMPTRNFGILNAYLHLLDALVGHGNSFRSSVQRTTFVKKRCHFLTRGLQIASTWWQEVNKGLLKYMHCEWTQSHRLSPFGIIMYTYKPRPNVVFICVLSVPTTKITPIIMMVGIRRAIIRLIIPIILIIPLRSILTLTVIIMLLWATATNIDDGKENQVLVNVWPEIQGVKWWKGLLDHMDRMLKEEILRYGNFAKICYDSFDGDRNSKYYGSCKYSEATLWRVGMPNSGYKVTKYWYANTDILSFLFGEKGRNLKLLMSTNNHKGFVAVCNDPKEIRRLGRHDIIVAWRGTQTPKEWVEDLRDILVPARLCHGTDATSSLNVSSSVRIEKGFLSCYTSSIIGEVEDSMRMTT
eukprot:Gb_16530 [translate_table: standard]